MNKKFTTTFKPEFLNELKIQAEKENLSVSELIQKMYKFYTKNKNMNKKIYDDDIF
jgi:predicted DNA-binding ribbon-helix-helix protein